jgi:hypothetical protein
MDAQEINNIGGDEKQRFDLPSLPERIEISVTRLHGVQ